jgi:hypothetical protein
MAHRIVSIMINGERWEVRRFDIESWFHRRPYSTVWLGGLPPGACIEEVEAAYVDVSGDVAKRQSPFGKTMSSRRSVNCF